MLKLLQVCNLGQITGGTGACAWTVARSLPELRHQVVFRGGISAEARERFRDWEPGRWERITAARVRESGADLVLLHNASRESVVESWGRPTINYLHSRITPAEADLWLCCSEWLREQYRRPELRVLRQGVPRPERPITVPFPRGETRGLVVGRLCTPTPRKWWDGIVEFYGRLAASCPEAWWEFVGCPERLRGELTEACRQRVTFHPASWEARRWLWTWDVMLYHHPGVTESFGRTVGDAFRAGCIPIVDRRGGFVEQLRDGPGVLCSDERDFIGALERFSEAGVRQREAARCRTRGEEHYSLGRFGRELLQAFVAVLSRPASQAARWR